ncbi:uncharacterized protein LOC144881034 isoform X1 [Branchiostoma floridae x Branchiostoma japonicum]
MLFVVVDVLWQGNKGVILYWNVLRTNCFRLAAEAQNKMPPTKPKKHKLSETTDCPVKAKVKTKTPALPDITTTSPYFSNDTTSSCKARLSSSFYDQTCLDLAKGLLGKIIVRKLDDGSTVSGMIVETEAYCGKDDKASHSSGSKKTERNAAMFMKPGTAYVYIIYGMHHCFNISSQGEGAAVLIRALQPLTGVEKMKVQRGQRRGDKGAGLKIEQLGNGPSKLCQALHIDKNTVNQQDLTTFPFIWLEPGEDVRDSNIIHSTRIGIDSAGEEWAKKPWRFYIRGNKSVSVRDKKAEKETENL